MSSTLHPDNQQTVNPTSNNNILDLIETRKLARRDFIKGSVGVAALAAIGGNSLNAAAAGAGTTGVAASATPLLGFTAVPANTLPMTDAVTVPEGYEVQVLVSWGDPVVKGAQQWDPATAMTEAIQKGCYGAHTDGMHYFPLPRVEGPMGASGRRGAINEHALLVTNSEYNDPGLVHSTTTYSTDPMTLDRARTQQAAQGVNIVEVRKGRNGWSVVRNSRLGRRITSNTPMTISGPAAGAAKLQTSTDATGTRVLGTINNCANGYTPWGTYLTCEENWNGNFGSVAADFVATSDEKRYGVSKTGFGYRWYEVEDRFDVRKEPNEPNRFGWVVEIDPYDPKSVPVKRTAMGRVKHESAGLSVGADNKVAFYMGDDERNEYVYKFVCAKPWTPGNPKANRNLLDDGTLYVARFNADGSGMWLPLVWGQNGLTPQNGFADQADVLIRTRQAADRLGATMMDRPEWTTVHPVTREVYLTLTNNSRRGNTPASSNKVDGTTSAGSANPPVDAANPRPDNDFGHIIRWREAGGDVAATTFDWDVFVQCGDKATTKVLGASYNPAEFGGQSVGYQGNILGDDYGAPDGLWFDQDGRLWIQTDQAGDAQGDWVNIGSNVMMAADPATGETRRFLTSPPYCEVTGVISTPDGKTLFVGIQHPGEDWVTSYTQNSSWPDNGANGATTASAMGPAKPRSSVVVITKRDRGVIGS
jgi:secreted PhoX family phosphatase